MPQTRLRQGVLKLGDFFEYFICKVGNCPYICSAKSKMVDVAQQVRASDCGSEGRRFEPDLPPFNHKAVIRKITALWFSAYPD